MIPLRQQLHHNLKTFYILVVKLVFPFPCYLGFLSCKHTTNTSNTQEKPQKMMVFYHINPCKRVVLALFSEHLSASENHNTLIYSIFKFHADSDRCFSTFIFLLCANIRGEYCVYTLLRMSLYMLYIKNFRQPYRILQQRPNNEQLRAKIINSTF